MLGSSLGSRVGPPAPHPIRFTIDDDEFELPELDTRTWLNALVVQPPGCWLTLIPAHLAGPGPQRVTDRLTDPQDSFDLDDLEEVAEQVLAAACGVDFYPARELARTAYGNWLLFDAWCCSVGFNPLSAPIARTLAAVWGWRLSLCADKSDLAKLDAEIWVMPPATTASGRTRDVAPPGWDDAAEAAAFDAAMAGSAQH